MTVTIGAGARVALMAIAQALIGAWVFVSAGEAPLGAAPLKGAGLRGQAVWRENGCASCHALFGLGGHNGPDLTNVIQRRGPAYVRAIVRHGARNMPPAAFGETDIDAVTAYLAHIDRLAVYPIDSYSAGAFGQLKTAPLQRQAR